MCCAGAERSLAHSVKVIITAHNNFIKSLITNAHAN